MTCENCYKGFVLPGVPKGGIVDGAYFIPAVGAKTEAGAPKKAVLLLTDIFGLDLVNPKLMADIFAERLGIDVWVPDLFDGHPPVTQEQLEPLMPDRAHVKMPVFTSFRALFHIIPGIPAFFRNRPSVADPRLKVFTEKLRNEKGYSKIGAVGYCWGGSMAVRIAGTPIVDTVVVCHPGSLSEVQIQAIKVPCAWACAEDDDVFNDKNRELAESILQMRKDTATFVDHEFKVYEGTAHGFAARPNLAVPEVKAAYEGVLDQTVAWFIKTL